MSNTPKNSIAKYIRDKTVGREQSSENSPNLSNGGSNIIRRLATLYFVQKVSELSIKHEDKFNPEAVTMLKDMRHLLSHLSVVNIQLIFNAGNSATFEELNSNNDEFRRLLTNGKQEVDFEKFMSLYATLGKNNNPNKRNKKNTTVKIKQSEEKLDHLLKAITTAKDQVVIKRYNESKKTFYINQNIEKTKKKSKNKTKNAQAKIKKQNQNQNQLKLYEYLCADLGMSTEQVRALEQTIIKTNPLHKSLSKLQSELANPRSSLPCCKNKKNGPQSQLDKALRAYNIAAKQYTSSRQSSTPLEIDINLEYKTALQVHYEIHENTIINKAKTVLELIRRIRNIFNISSTLQKEVQDTQAYTQYARDNQSLFFTVVENDFQSGCYSRTRLRDSLENKLTSSADRCDAARFAIACVWEVLSPLSEYHAFNSLFGGKHIRNYIFHNDPTALPQALYMENATTYLSDSPECISQQLYMLCINVFHNLTKAIESAEEQLQSHDISQARHRY